MKKRLSSAVSILLAAVMLLVSVPFSVSAASDDQMIISASTKNAVPGQTVDVDISMKNNPGISSVGLSVAYDSDILTIENITFNPEIGGSTQASQYTKNPAKIIWISPTSNYTNDAVIATFTFRVNADIQDNIATDIELSYDPDDIYDIDENNIECLLENGKVNVVASEPGDINGDGKVNNKDATRLMQYLSAWDVFVNEPCLDTNGDGKVNNKDATRLMQFLAGWDVELHVGPTSVVACTHNLSKTEAVAPGCETAGNIAFWHCSKCGKYYEDANAVREIKQENTVVAATGHKPEVIPAVPATYESVGYTEGTRCSVCGEILEGHEPYGPLEKNEYPITYHLYADDAYLQSVGVENPNPDSYISQDGLRLQNIRAEGYVFEGWYDGEGANGELVKTIPAGTTGEVELYAKWTEREYTINFDSPDVPVPSIKYTVSKGATLTNAKCYGYTFVGWSDDNGFLRSKIKPGTTGNLTLHANWTSNRNRATAFSSYAEPSIIEDNTTGQFLFVYDIGRIDNVPLSQIEYLGNSDGISVDSEYQVINTIEKSNAEKIANTVSNTTTRSSGWTLSEEWNKIYEAGNEVDETKGKSVKRTDIEGNVVGGNYFVSNSKGGSSYLSTDSGGSFSNSARVTTENSKGINTSYDQSTEKYCDVKLGIKNETEVSAGVSLPIDIVKVSAGVKNTTTVSAETSNGRRDKEAFHVDTSSSSFIGTDRQSSESGYYNVSASQSSNWNSTESYEKSYQQSRSTEVSSAINEQITKKTTYNMTDSLGGANSKHEEVGGTEGREDEYSSSLQYSEGDSSSKTQRITFRSNEPGYYRLVNAGTLHVFAVVGYDVATSSYYTYNYTVLDDERHTYLDYSKDNALFTDCENALVPFEIPTEINDYVTALTTKSDDLEFGLDGRVNGYDGTEDNATVILPQYYSAMNGADGSYSAIKINSFDTNTFKGNKQIEKVVLPVYVTEIPDNAFEGCTNLKEIVAMGVTKIGDNAFKGCTSLRSFSIDNKVTSLGNNAFEGVDEIKVMASKVSVFNAALESGAKKITINVSNMSGSIDNRILMIDNSKEYFALLSNGTTYSNLKIKSEAAETYISNMKLTDNRDTPLDINSSKLTLNRVSVEDAPGFALILRNDSTDVSLYDTIQLASASGNAILSKSISLRKENNDITSKLNALGDVLVCGTVTNDTMLNVSDNNNNAYEIITESDYNRYITSAIVTFDSNGGDSLEENTKTIYYGQLYGTMPVPERENYDFVGWFTSKAGGEQITAETPVTTLANQTLFAHWSESQFTVTFDANNGQVSPTSKTVTFGDKYGEIPVPTRSGFTFLGWYNGENVFTAETIAESAQDITLRARWQSDWTLESNKPDGREVVNTKWSYTEREYTTNGASSLSGWTKYDTKVTGYGGTQGPVYSNPGGNNRKVWSEEYVSASGTRWHYSRSISGASGWNSYNVNISPSWGYLAYSQDITLDYKLDCTDSNWNGLGARYGKYYYNGFDCPYWFNEWSEYWETKGTRWYYQDPIYTYYYYRDVNKESASEITNGGNISNTQKWVKYIEK